MNEFRLKTVKLHGYYNKFKVLNMSSSYMMVWEIFPKWIPYHIELCDVRL